MPEYPFADISYRDLNGNHNQWEALIVKTQNMECQRNRKPIKIWGTISQFHPYKNEILNVVKILNSIGANCKIIAATLDLQGWKTFYGVSEWTEEDVQGLLE